MGKSQIVSNKDPKVALRLLFEIQQTSHHKVVFRFYRVGPNSVITTIPVNINILDSQEVS